MGSILRRFFWETTYTKVQQSKLRSWFPCVRQQILIITIQLRIKWANRKLTQYTTSTKDNHTLSKIQSSYKKIVVFFLVTKTKRISRTTFFIWKKLLSVLSNKFIFRIYYCIFLVKSYIFSVSVYEQIHPRSKRCWSFRSWGIMGQLPHQSEIFFLPPFFCDALSNWIKRWR